MRSFSINRDIGFSFSISPHHLFQKKLLLSPFSQKVKKRYSVQSSYYTFELQSIYQSMSPYHHNCVSRIEVSPSFRLQKRKNKNRASLHCTSHASQSSYILSSIFIAVFLSLLLSFFLLFLLLFLLLYKFGARVF